jgi:hypothetical protein
MKLDKDPFPANMNMVELDGKKVLIHPSQARVNEGQGGRHRRRVATKDD